MKIEAIKIEKINPAAYNPRIDLKPGNPQYEKLKKSINTFGYVEPLVWNSRTGNLVGGHQRFKILKEIGFVDLTGSGQYDSKSIKRKTKEVTDKWGRTGDHIDFGRPPIGYDPDDDDGENDRWFTGH